MWLKEKYNLKLAAAILLIILQSSNAASSKRADPAQLFRKLCDVETSGECDTETEKCVAQTEGYKVGECQCKTPLMRTADGKCLSAEAAESSPRPIVQTPSTTHTGGSLTTSPVDGSSKKTELLPLTFEVEGPLEVKLPTNSATLRVLLPPADTQMLASNPNALSFHWVSLEGAGLSTTKSYNEQTLELTELKAGQLVYKVAVSNATHSGTKQYKLTVTPAAKENKPPKARIIPASPVKGTEGRTLVLDAEGSTDDEKGLSYKWTQDTGPSVTLPAMNTAILHLDNLLPGSYKFSVTVTDAGDLSDTATVDVEVEAERDDAPKAHASECGSSVSGSITVRLPLPQLQLCGNSSSDDKGIVSYNWFRVDSLANKLPVDTAGSSTSVLTLTNLHATDKLGPYEFKLDVVDTKGQKDSTKINIFVNEAQNLAPVADAGGNHTLLLPDSSIVLDGNVRDDGSIVVYNWSQISGPEKSILVNADKAKATVSGLQEGIYHFRLFVQDDGGLNATDDAYIAVERSHNEPPKAVAQNVSIHLPTSIAVLNASGSTDDAGIVSYLWQPLDDVPAAMTALDGSERKAAMFVSGLVKGVHGYNLTVEDQQHEKDSIIVYLIVENGVEDEQSVELLMLKPINEWTYRLRRKLKSRISAALASSIQEVNTVDVHFTRFEEMSLDGRLRAVFYAKADTNGIEMRKRSPRDTSIASNGIIKADTVVQVLRQEGTMKEDFHISAIQTLYCKLNCSGHGKCSDATKECVCDRFWMSSLFTYLASGGRAEDCAWSSVYFALIAVFSLIGTVSCLLFRRRSPVWGRVSRRRFRRRKRYSSLHSDSEDEKEVRRIRSGPRLAPLPIPNSSDSLNSESDDLLHRDMANGWDSMNMRERSSGAESRL